MYKAVWGWYWKRFAGILFSCDGALAVLPILPILPTLSTLLTLPSLPGIIPDRVREKPRIEASLHAGILWCHRDKRTPKL